MDAGLKNAAFLTGPSDLLVMMSALARDDIILSRWIIVLMSNGGNIPPAMLDTCRVMAPGAEVFILDVQDEAARNALLAHTGRRFSTVAISHLLGKGEEAVLSALDWDELILTENGIATHILPAGRVRRLGPDGRPGFSPDAAILPLASWPGMGLPSYLDPARPPRLIATDPGFYRHLHARLQAAFALTPLARRIAVAPTFALVAGTSKCRKNLLSEAAESEAYRTRLAALAEGRRAAVVLWKPHPRLTLDIAAMPDGVITEERPLPIELFLPFDHPAGSMHSTSSTSLLFAHLWHNVTPHLIDVDMDTTHHPQIEKIWTLVSALD